MSKADALRKRAESLLRADSKRFARIPRQDIQNLVHELDVHQVELELQNEELLAAQRQLQEAHDRYVVLYEHAPVGYVTLDAEGRLLQVNLAAAEMLGGDRSELIGTRLTHYIHPDDEDVWYLHHRQLFTLEPPPPACELRVHHGDAVRTVQAACLRSPDSSGSMLVALTDITARKEAEFGKARADAALQEELLRHNEDLERRVAERTAQLEQSEGRVRHQLDELEMLYATAPVGLAVLTPDLRCLRINETLAELSGSCATEVIGRPLDEAAPHLDSHLAPICRRVVETRTPILNQEVRSPWPSDPDVQGVWLISVHPLLTESETVRAVSIVVQDITDLTRAQDDLRRVERLASLGTFAAGIAHEINNPVGAIATAAEAAVRLRHIPDATDRVDDCLELIVEQAERCGQITHDVLQFAKCESAAKQPEDLSNVVLNAVELSRPYAEKYGAVLRIETGGPVPLVPMNRFQMERVLMNLIRNGIEAVKPGGCVSVRTYEIRGGVRVVVQDNGPGLPVRDPAKLFEPFFTTRPEQGGTGLGLSIAHGIVEEHGGTLRVDAELTEGARFMIELPFQSPVATAPQT